MPGDVLVRLEPVDEPSTTPPAPRRRRRHPPARPPAPSRADLAEVVERHRVGLDEAPPGRRGHAGGRAAGARPARTSPTSSTTGSFVEYGPLVIAAQRRRRDLDDLIANTPGRRPRRRHRHGQRRAVRRRGGARASPCRTTTPCSPAPRALQNHRKKDRLFELAERLRLPIVFFTEGGGGRPGDTDGAGPSGLDCLAFLLLRRAVRARAARRRQRRLLLRRQRRDPRLLRRRHRHRGLEHRHGRPGDDRGRRARRVRADGDRPDRGAAGQRRRRHRRRRRGRGGRRRQAVPVVLPGPRRRRGSAPTRRCCATSCPPTGCAATTCARAVELLFDTGSVLELRRGLRARDDHRAGPHRGPAGRRDRQQPDPPRRRHRHAGRRQGRPVHAAVRRLRPADRSRCATRRG